MGNHKSTIKTESYEIENDSINEEIDMSSSTECDLYNIIRSGKVASFEEWLEKLPSIVTTTDRNGNNLMHLATYLNRSAMIRHISQYADVNGTNKSGDTPLHIAASKGYKECIEALLGSSANVNVKNTSGTTPLHIVTTLGRNDCVEVLLSYGADVNVHTCRSRCTTKTAIIEPGDFIVLKGTHSLGDENLQKFASSFAGPQVSFEDNNDEFKYDSEIFELPGENVYYKIDQNCVPFAAPTPICLPPSLTKINYEHAPPMMRGMKFAEATNKIGYQLDESREKVLELEVLVDSDGDSPLQCAINSKNFAIFNLMIDYASTLTITDDSSFKLVEKAMTMNVPGVLRCLIGNPFEDNCKEFTVDYLDQRLNSCIEKQGKNIVVNYHPLIPSTFRSMETLLLIFLGISKDNNFESLLQHPTVRTFLQWRWSQISKYFYMNLYFFCIVYLNIIIYKSQYYCKNNKFDTNGYISYNLLYLNLIHVIIKEIFQIGFNWKSYLLNCENYFGICLIIYSIILLIWYPSDIATRIQVSAIGNILIAVSATLQIGQHPWAASAVHLLKVVAHRFLRHFIVYIGILVGFAYSFHELHSIDKLGSNLEGATNTTSEETTDSLNWLEFAGFTILRTAGMFIGELNLGDFNVDKSNYVLITILFLFILFVSIMMLNLLNGLAVSNIFEKEELRVSLFKMRIQYLYSLNSKINLFNKIVNRFPKIVQKILKRVIPSVCDNYYNAYILILPTYLNCKDLKISDDQQYIHNNKIHKSAYEILQKYK